MVRICRGCRGRCHLRWRGGLEAAETTTGLAINCTVPLVFADPSYKLACSTSFSLVNLRLPCHPVRYPFKQPLHLLDERSPSSGHAHVVYPFVVLHPLNTPHSLHPSAAISRLEAQGHRLHNPRTHSILHMKAGRRFRAIIIRTFIVRGMQHHGPTLKTLPPRDRSDCGPYTLFILFPVSFLSCMSAFDNIIVPVRLECFFPQVARRFPS